MGAVVAREEGARRAGEGGVGVWGRDGGWDIFMGGVRLFVKWSDLKGGYVEGLGVVVGERIEKFIFCGSWAAQ